jgi:hypothetical protein
MGVNNVPPRRNIEFAVDKRIEDEVERVSVWDTGAPYMFTGSIGTAVGIVLLARVQSRQLLRDNACTILPRRLHDRIIEEIKLPGDFSHVARPKAS